MASKEEMVAQMYYSADYEDILEHAKPIERIKDISLPLPAAIEIGSNPEFKDWKELTQLLQGPEGEHVKHVSFHYIHKNFMPSKEFIKLATSRMTTLQVWGTSDLLSNEAIDWLSEAIKSSDCTLKTWDLRGCLNMEGAKRLAESGLFNQIERLIIHGELIVDDLTCFVEPLRNPECKIWELGLCLRSFDWLADVVNGCGLRKLASNFWPDECNTSGLPVKLIEALKKPDCKVEGLELEETGSFDEGACRNLAECFRDSTSLLFFQLTSGLNGVFDTYAQAIENSRLTHFLLLDCYEGGAYLDRQILLIAAQKPRL